MIRSFRHKGLEGFFLRDDGRRLPEQQLPKIRRILTAIDAAEKPDEVGLFPGWRLHPLSGNLEGFWSVTVTGNDRIIFRLEDGDAFDLDYVDYH